MKRASKLLSFLLALVFILAACTQAVAPKTTVDPQKGDKNVVVESSNGDKITENTTFVPRPDPEKGTYNEGVALIKLENGVNDEVLAEVASAEPLYDGSEWYLATLNAGTDTVEEIARLNALDFIDKADYDYVMGVGADMVSVDITSNPKHEDQVNLGISKIPYGWTQNGKAPGGSPDVIIAVIDTGVDYNHLDLRNNIWVNSAEIPDNGVDDDDNGYVDDVYGWDCVGDDNDPMDDNGHGTHVAGIVAAENNKVGGIGVAYNCKVMVVKAGNSSGYFNNSDIAEAIQYAYMNGASVINMSFGGSNISIAVEEALENAYNSCVLVAAAGNDGACNNLNCLTCTIKKVSYPAALPYVIGVMSTGKGGQSRSSFSNYDHCPYDSIEYEVFAVGEGVGSTWPNNKYACLNGTSMAAPTVAGIAALLRSYYSDREVYSTKFIQSQIVNTGSLRLDGAHTVADAYEAMTKLPKPSVNLYDYFIDDSVSISEKNNGNGVIDAGETVRLYISLHNRGGVASNVNVTIDTYRSEIGDEALTDPYFTFVNNTIQLSDIGTYSVRESGDKYFEIIVDSNCPNDYLVDFNIRFTYTNGMNVNDASIYQGAGVAQFIVSRGFYLPPVIKENTTYTADKFYIIGDNVTIAQGVTVTFEEGCQIQFYDERGYDPNLIVYGTLNFQGCENAMIEIGVSDHVRYSGACITVKNGGYLSANYVYLSRVNIVDEHFTGAYTGNPLNHSVFSNSWIINDRDSFNYTVGSILNCLIKSAEPLYIKAQLIDSCCLIVDGNGVLVEGFHDYYSYTYSNCGELKNNYICTFDGNSSVGYSSLACKDIRLIQNNIFTTSGTSSTYNELLLRIAFEATTHEPITDTVFSNNAFSLEYQKHASRIIEGYYDSKGNPTVDVYSSIADASILWPHIVSVEMFDKDGNPITRVGKEEIKVRVTFNRPMDKNAGTFLTFGTIEPYGDYRIDGEYISDTVWEGTYTLKAQIENGQNFLKVNNAWAAEDQTKTVFGEYHLHEFTIDTTAAMSMNLQAVAKENGIELTFAQDDYDTLLGYNIYRAESKDGNYVRLNPAILLPDESTFLDENAEPGKTYWYTYTVVLTDFTESNPAGKVVATAMDTEAPNMYHTPVNQGYMNNNLVISCTASDNVAITSVTLFYRAVGTTEWKTLNMSKHSNKYSATVFGSDLTLDGIEYYIVASDGINTINKGTSDAPYTVVIKDASMISRKGDVDGDGVVTTKDALMLMQCINGDLILSDDEFKRADLNGDGTLNSSEALRILQYINGKVNSLEM